MRGRELLRGSNEIELSSSHPEALKIVLGTNRLVEDVCYDVSTVDQYPLTLFVSLDREGTDAELS